VEYVIQKQDTSISKIAQKCGVNPNRWPEFCAANPKLKKDPNAGCLFFVGKTVNIPDAWACAALSPGPVIPAPGPNQPPGPAPAPGAPGAPGPIAPVAPSSEAEMFGLDKKTIMIGAAVIGLGVVAVYFLKKKSQAAQAA